MTLQLIVDCTEKQPADDNMYMQLTVYFYCLPYSLMKGHWIWVNGSRTPPVPILDV